MTRRGTRIDRDLGLGPVKRVPTTTAPLRSTAAVQERSFEFQGEQHTWMGTLHTPSAICHASDLCQGEQAETELSLRLILDRLLRSHPIQVSQDIFALCHNLVYRGKDILSSCCWFCLSLGLLLHTFQALDQRVLLADGAV